MGIKELLRFTRPYIEPIHIKKYSGKRVGIDAYSWLHKGAYSCSMELCLNSEGVKKLQYLNYFMHRIDLLRHHKVTPVVVFDGGSIPCKAGTTDDRQRKRKTSRDLAIQKLSEGDAKAAFELFQRGVSVTPSMAHQLIQILISEEIEFVVAPYEADAQLAYLSSLEVDKGGIEAVISEDSDLLAYGCQAVFFKMDRYGNGEEMVIQKVFDSTTNCTPSFCGFTQELFIGMCVLAGCDFLPSVPGIGIRKAYSLVSKYKNLDRVISVLKIEKGNLVPEVYSKSFQEAISVFQHALIYDTATKKLRHLKPLPEKLLQSLDGKLDFLGPEIPPSVATAIARGKIDPISMEAFDHSQGNGFRRVSKIIPTSDQLCQKKAKKNSFLVLSFKETTKSEFITMKQQNPASNEDRYLKEAAALVKLILPSKPSQKSGISTRVDSIPLEVPSNNPFRIKKAAEMSFSEEEEEEEEASSALTYVETASEMPFMTDNIFPESITEGGKHCTKRKPDGFCSDQEDNNTQQVSQVTDLGEDGVILSIKHQSQESVNSKPSQSKIKSTRETKLKRKKSKSSSDNNSSILNFFSRL